MVIMILGCSSPKIEHDFDPNVILSKEIIDLSPVIGEDLPWQKWGTAATKRRQWAKDINKI